MIYASEGPINPLFERSDPTQQTEEYLLQLLGVVALLSGPVQWTSEASELISKFNFDWRQRLADPLFPDVCDEWPIPIHSKLLHYNRSRTMFIIKLSMISAIAARHELVIRPSDILRALRWLLDAEILMPDIFREMRGKSDREVIDELHRFVINQWSKDKKKPGVPGSLMATFLSQRVPSEKVPSVLMLAERMDLIVRVAGTQDTWLPRPRFGAPGVE
jgi:hypothetical protein